MPREFRTKSLQQAGNKKRTDPSFIVQAGILAAAGILSRLLGFAYKIPMYRMLGDTGTGIYNQGYYIYNFLLVLSSAGLPAAISKMVSSRLALYQSGNAYGVFRVSLRVAALIGAAGGLALFFGADFFAGMLQSPESVYSIRALSPTVFIVAVMSVFRGYFQGMNNMAPTALSQIIEQAVNAVFSIFLVYLIFRTSIPYAAAGGNAATGLGALAGLVILLQVYRKNRQDIRADIIKNRVYSSKEKPLAVASELFRTAVPIIAGTAVFSLTSLIDSVMVMRRLMHNGAFTEAQSTAMFGQLSGSFFTITTMPVGIATAMGTAAIPGIAAAVAKRDGRAITARMNMAVRMAMIICVPAAFGIGVLADQIQTLLFPASSADGTLLKVGFISIIFLALNQISSAVLQGMGQARIPVIAAVIGCFIKVALNYFLLAIPSINILGAVIGTIICYAVASPINVYYAYRYTGARPDISSIFIKPVACSVVMAMLCFVVYHTLHFIIPSNLFCLMVAIFIGIGFYFLAMAMYGGITRNDFHSVPMGDKMLSALDLLGIQVK